MSKRAIILCVSILLAWAAIHFARPLLYPAKVDAHEVYSKETPPAVRIDHSAYNALLKKYVINGRVDYAGLKQDQPALQGYLKSLESIDPKVHSRDELLALFVNAYNAATLELILEEYPAITSIKDIPTSQRWTDKRWIVAGDTLSLSDLENNVLRKRFAEPRVHFAINCASNSCPVLRNEAYTGEKIESQLQDQAQVMNREFGGAQWDEATGTLKLSKIYDWYDGDFTRAMPLKDYVAQFASPEAAEQIKKRGKVNIVFQDYDWSLNKASK